MKFKSLMAILLAISVATSHATEKQSLLSRMFGAVFSSASTVKEKAFCDTPNQIASVTTVGLVSAILGWFGYKKYQKQQEIIPVQKHELRQALASVKEDKKIVQMARSKGAQKEKVLLAELETKNNDLYNAAKDKGILSTEDTKEMLDTPEIKARLYINPKTSELIDLRNQIKSKLRVNKSKIIQVDNHLRSIEKKEEDLLRQEKNFSFFDSLFFRSPLKSSKR